MNIVLGALLLGGIAYHVWGIVQQRKQPPRYVVPVVDYERFVTDWITDLKRNPAPDDVINATRNVTRDVRDEFLIKYRVD